MRNVMFMLCLFGCGGAFAGGGDAATVLVLQTDPDGVACLPLDGRVSCCPPDFDSVGTNGPAEVCLEIR